MSRRVFLKLVLYNFILIIERRVRFVPPGSHTAQTFGTITDFVRIIELQCEPERGPLMKKIHKGVIFYRRTLYTPSKVFLTVGAIYLAHSCVLLVYLSNIT